MWSSLARGRQVSPPPSTRRRRARRAGARGYGARRPGRLELTHRELSRIPTGISGQDLAGGRSCRPKNSGGGRDRPGAVGLDCASKPYKVRLATARSCGRGRSLLQRREYRKPALPELSRSRTGVMYSATHMEAQLCKGEEIAIVGGGNSAGQATVFLSQTSAEVNVLVRGPGSRRACLATSSSESKTARTWCCARARRSTRSRAPTASSGSMAPARHRESQTRSIRHLFLMTGADPNTAWLKGCLALDDKNSSRRELTSSRMTSRSGMAAGPSTRSAGDEQAGRLRGRRCQVGQREARRVGGGEARCAFSSSTGRCASLVTWGPEMAPTPNVRSAPAQPGRSSNPSMTRQASSPSARERAVGRCRVLAENGRLAERASPPPPRTARRSDNLRRAVAVVSIYACARSSGLDRGMSLGLAVVGIAPTPSIFAPVSTPALAIRELSFLVLAIVTSSSSSSRA